ncbi:unnamed protein product [Protopolystoma xenopodis]|uniref:Uncharacterized protein n=1 Tax=Protopolystoma xenopodis TaxID=117903 RepID=A0A3S4ZZ38_9PLAT|nr:unnamed protein product [Protopolystoma xenopodis]
MADRLLVPSDTLVACSFLRLLKLLLSNRACSPSSQSHYSSCRKREQPSSQPYCSSTPSTDPPHSSSRFPVAAAEQSQNLPNIPHSVSKNPFSSSFKSGEAFLRRHQLSVVSALYTHGFHDRAARLLACLASDFRSSNSLQSKVGIGNGVRAHDDDEIRATGERRNVHQTKQSRADEKAIVETSDLLSSPLAFDLINYLLHIFLLLLSEWPTETQLCQLVLQARLPFSLALVIIRLSSLVLPACVSSIQKVVIRGVDPAAELASGRGDYYNTAISSACTNTPSSSPSHPSSKAINPDCARSKIALASIPTPFDWSKAPQVCREVDCLEASLDCLNRLLAFITETVRRALLVRRTTPTEAINSDTSKDLTSLAEQRPAMNVSHPASYSETVFQSHSRQPPMNYTIGPTTLLGSNQKFTHTRSHTFTNHAVTNAPEPVRHPYLPLSLVLYIMPQFSLAKSFISTL